MIKMFKYEFHCAMPNNIGWVYCKKLLFFAVIPPLIKNVFIGQNVNIKIFAQAN